MPIVAKHVEAAEKRGLLAEPATVEMALAVDHDARSLACDLSDESEREDLIRRVNETGWSPTLLVNNAGLGDYGEFSSSEWEKVQALLDVNIAALTHLTHGFLPPMIAAGRGAILNVSSLAGDLPIPDFAVYAASKAYVSSFSEALRLELRGSGVHVVLIEPGPIESRFRPNAYAAYKRHIDPHASIHRDRYLNMEQRLLKEGPVVPFTLPPEAVLKKVVRALESPRPKARYHVTFPTGLFAVLKRVLTQNMLDKVLVRI